MKSESQVVREICDWLATQYCYFWRSNNIAAPGRAMPKYTPKGLPDIFVMMSGHMIGFEVKREGSDTEREANGRKIRQGMLSPQQADFGLRFSMHGGKYACVRSLQEAKSELVKLGLLPAIE